MQDWEYPGAYDRGGVPADTKNYVNFMAAVKSAFSQKGYGLTFTAPSSYWYLQHFDLPGMTARFVTVPRLCQRGFGQECSSLPIG
jgi:GH18 family chitinase